MTAERGQHGVMYGGGSGGTFGQISKVGGGRRGRLARPAVFTSLHLVSGCRRGCISAGARRADVKDDKQIIVTTEFLDNDDSDNRTLSIRMRIIDL